MLDTENKRRREQQKQKVKKRYNVTINPKNYKFIPAKKQTDYYDDDVNQRVAIYVRVSTDDVRQTTSYELQKKYYEEFVTRHPNWTLVNIYADACIIIGQTGQSLAATGFAPFWSYYDSLNSTEGDNRKRRISP